MTMIVVDKYTLPPGCCLVCYSSPLPALSTGIDIHQPGQLADAEVVICNRCVLTMARLIAPHVGYEVVSQAELAETRDTIEELTGRIIELNDARDLAYGARDAVLASYGARGEIPPAEVEVADDLAADELAAVLVEEFNGQHGGAFGMVIKAHMTATVSEAEPEVEVEPPEPKSDAPPPKRARK